MIKLSKRLTALAELVLEDHSTSGVVDVGCDHALLDIYLLQNDPNLTVVASDIHPGPLQKAKENISKYSLLSKITLVLADGIIDNLPREVNTVVISGMGEESIAKILENGKNKLGQVEKLVLSSNNKYKELREKVMELEYSIEEEKIVLEDGKFYILMKCVKGRSNYSLEELYFGPYLLRHKDELFSCYCDYLERQKREVLRHLPNRLEEKKRAIEEELELLHNRK